MCLCLFTRPKLPFIRTPRRPMTTSPSSSPTGARTDISSYSAVPAPFAQNPSDAVSMTNEESVDIDEDVSWMEGINDDILFRIFKATIGRPTHFCYPNHVGLAQDPDDDYFGDRRGIIPTQNSKFPMVFVLPRVCQRWRSVMKKFPSIWSRASVTVKPKSPAVTLRWWSQHAHRLESLYLDGYQWEGPGNLTSMNLGILSLLNVHYMKALCLGDCFEDGASRAVLQTICHLTNLQQLQIYRADHSFIGAMSLLTQLSILKVLELGYHHIQGGFPYAELSSSCFPMSLEKLALCEAIMNVDLVMGEHLSNLKCLKLMSSAVSGHFCQHVGNLPLLTRLVVHDSLLEGGHESSLVNSDFLPDDLRRMTTLQHIKELSIHGMDCGQRGYFEWMGEEVLRDPPFSDLQSLSLCFRSVGVMSDRFDDYRCLRQLYIEDIQFETIPDSILRLPELVRLEMISCEISSFPESVPFCSESISILNLCGNKLRVIPKALSNWSHLQVLDFTLNPILDFTNIECLLALPKLKTVMLLEGEQSLDITTLDTFCQEFAHMLAALKLGYVCAKLSEKSPACRVFL